MGDHRALGTPSRSRCVEQPCEVVSGAGHRLVAVVHGGGHCGERASAVGIEIHHGEDAEFVGKGPQLRLARRIADDQLRACILDKVGDFRCGVGRVERLVDGTRLQHREVEQNIGDGLFHLHRHAVAWFHA